MAKFSGPFFPLPFFPWPIFPTFVHVSSFVSVSFLIIKMEFTQTEKGQRKAIRHGYMYVFHMANNLTSWECVLRKRGQCEARIKLTATDDFVEQTNEHTHPPNQTQCEVVEGWRRLVSNVKQKQLSKLRNKFSQIN